MIPSRDTALAFCAVPEIGELLLRAEAAWIWARDGSRILWANPAGGARLGAADFGALSARRWEEGHQLRRAIVSLQRAIPPAGTLARLRLTDDLLALPIACSCRPVRSGEERGVLVTALNGAGAKPSLADVAAFFTTADTGAIVLDEQGGVLAEGVPGIAEARTYATPSTDLEDGGRALSLCFVELGVPVNRRRAQPPAPAAERWIEPAPADPPPVAEPQESDTQKVAEPAPPPTMPPPEPHQELHPEPDPPAEPETPTEPEAPAEPARSAEPEKLAEPRARAPRESQAQPHSQSQPHSVTAGRVARELSQKPVRFLWQTDADDRYLFVSPGLAQVVGRNAEIIGERWHDAAARLRLDPTERIAHALGQHDTWSGLTAWWPIEGSNVRVPVELTALPVFSADQSFQGYRGFGILRPAEALMPASFESRFGRAEEPPAEPRSPDAEAADPTAGKVVPIRADLERMAEHERLSPQERMAFEEIAAALQRRVIEQPFASERAEDEAAPEASAPEAEPLPVEPPAPRDAPEPQEARPEPLDAPPESRPEMSLLVDLFPPEEESAAPLPSEIAASDAERRLREMIAILDTATDGVVIVDSDGVIESVNASAEALFGLDAREMQDRPFVDLLTPESRELVLDYLSGLKDSGVASLLNEGREVAASAGSGSIPLFMTMGRISSEEGGRFCAVLRDITHWKRIEKELTEAKRIAEEASRQKSDFLARVSHEIRTPLNAIIGFAEVMIEERFGPVDHERYREYLRDIRTSGEHVVSLVNDLLDISKIEAGRLDMHFAAVPLNALVRECIALMQPQANRSHVVLRSSLSRDVPGIVADERTMRQIVLNLLSNSVKYTEPGGQVIASTSLSDSGEAILRVRDTGDGMSEDELERALEPFRQLSNAGLTQGTGLGLPLTKALVEANRATLSIKSARGEGTVVTVTIPPTRVLSE